MQAPDMNNGYFTQNQL